jgi:hypothetical protein
MKVKELIKQLLDEDLDADVVIFCSGVAVDVDGISCNYQSSKVLGMSIGAVCIEPDSPIQRW